MTSPRNEMSEKESIKLEIAKLGSLVNANNLGEIQAIVARAKTVLGESWNLDDKKNIAEVVRDAVLLGQLVTVRFFLDEGVSPYTQVCRSSRSNSSDFIPPLIWFAASAGYLSIVELLVEKGVDIKPREHVYNSSNEDILMRAAIENGHANIVAYLIEHGASIHTTYYDTTFLAEAVENENIRIIELLLLHGASIENTFYIMYKKFKGYHKPYTQAIEESNSGRKKEELIIALDKHTAKYSRMVKTLLDCSIGCDLSPSEDTLDFLKLIDIADFSFIGVSINGCPITREMLVQKKIKGAERALVTTDNLANLQGTSRHEDISRRLEKRMQEQGKMVDDAGVVNLVPLWCSAQIGDIAAITIRLSAGINPNDGVAKSHHIPIVLAAQNGHLDAVKLLAEHPAIDKKTFIKAIEQARDKYPDLAAYLSGQQDVNNVDDMGNTLLHKAAAQGDVQQVLALIAKRANVNMQNNDGQTPLALAASLEEETGSNVVDVLLKNKANANLYKFATPLYCAVRTGNSKSVALLLPYTEKRELIRINGYDGSEKRRDPWYADLIFSTLNLNHDERFEILSLLRAHGADFNAKSEYGDTFLLHQAILSHQAIQLLPRFTNPLNTPFDLENPDYYWQINIKSKLESFTKAFELFNFLLEEGADINLSDKMGNTPLHLLVQEVDMRNFQAGYIPLLELFVKKGANVNAKNIYGETPLHKAARVDCLFVIEFLLSHGADMNATNTNKLTPLHIATEYGYANIMLNSKRGIPSGTIEKQDQSLATTAKNAVKELIRQRIALHRGVNQFNAPEESYTQNAAAAAAVTEPPLTMKQ